MKKIFFSLILSLLFVYPVSAATTKPLTTTQLKAQIVDLQKQVAVLNDNLSNVRAQNAQYISYFQPMVDLVSSTKATNIQLQSLVQQYSEAAQKAVNLMNQYKSMCSAAANSYSAPTPVVTSAPIPTVAPVIKCFYGYTVECFDYSQFPTNLIEQLNTIAQKPISMQSIVGSQLQAIHNAGF